MHLSPVVHAQHLKKKRKIISPCSARVQPLRWNLHSDLLVRSMFTFQRSASAAIDHHRHLLDSVGIVYKLLEGEEGVWKGCALCSGCRGSMPGCLTRSTITWIFCDAPDRNCNWIDIDEEMKLYIWKRELVAKVHANYTLWAPNKHGH